MIVADFRFLFFLSTGYNPGHSITISESEHNVIGHLSMSAVRSTYTRSSIMSYVVLTNCLIFTSSASKYLTNCAERS